MRKLATILSVVALAGCGTACTTINTQPDEVGLVYDSGPFQATSYRTCVGSSAKTFDGPNDLGFSYPAGQRTYDFSGAKGSDGRAIGVVSADNQQLTVRGVVRFELATDCTKLRRFHERIGLKFAAYNVDGQTSPGWDRVLNTYMRQPIERAMDQASQGYGWKQLYNDPVTKAAWEKTVTALIPTYIKQAMGDAYFGSFSVTIQKPDAPGPLVEALQAEQKAVAENNAQKKKNETSRTRYDSFTDCKKVLSEQSCLLLYAIDSGKVDLIPVPNGTGLNVTPRWPWPTGTAARWGAVHAGASRR